MHAAITDLDGLRLETAWHGTAASAPTLVLLHEGLGCVSMWRDFPEQLAEATGCAVLAYSRAGYGRSDPVPLPRPLSYMHDEARDVLGRLLDHFAVRRAVLVGHSDGASIAAIYAGTENDPRVEGLVLMAPHFVVEDESIAAIAAAKRAFETGDLRARLVRHHGANVDCAFRGWSDAWLDPRFRAWDITGCLPAITVPVLVIQGEDDEYGTLRQIELAKDHCGGPVDSLVLAWTGHLPARDQPEKTLSSIKGFVSKITG